jgi:methyl-accepting chemotaxis protein
MPENSVSFGIGRKFFLLFGGISIAFLALIAAIVWQLLNVNDELNAMNELHLPALSKISEINGSLFLQHAVLGDFVAKVERGDQVASLARKTDFVTAGQRASDLLGDSPESVALRKLTREIIDMEEALGNLDAAQRQALDLDAITQQYSDYSGQAQALLNMNAASPQFDAINDQIDELVTVLEKSLLRFHSQIVEFVNQDAAGLASQSRRMILVVSIATAVIFFLALWTTSVLITKITSPLRLLTRVSTSIAGSDLGTQVDRVTTGDELEVLADSFREMSGNLRQQINEMRSGIETLSSAISEIGTSIQEQAASAKEEAATIQEITTTMQEIQQSGSEISQRAKEVSSNAENTLTAGEAGLSAVSKTSESMERIRQQVEEVAEKIVSLSEKTQAIGEITTTVNEIAEQSNILAINASIEAASAGESGSRFAVVAREMKHLADQAKSSTKMVRSILEEIQKGITTSVMLTEEAVKRTESGRAQASLAEGNIHKLAESIQSNVQTFQQIIAGTGQQQIGVNQVVQGMQDIKQAVQQTVTGISQLEQATRSLNEMSQSLRSFVARYKL